MRYVSLFSGVEAATVAWSRLGWEPLAFAEVDEFPAAVLAHRFPDVPNLGDVCGIDWEEFHEKHGAVDVLVGGSPCFPAGTLVLCESGFKPIEQVEVGDMVVTHKGRLKRVLKTGHREAEVGTLKVRSMMPIKCTANHPILTSSRTKRGKRGKDGSWWRFSGEEFVPASETVGSCACAVTHVDADVPGMPSVGKSSWTDRLELVGWYLGDGSIAGKGRKNPTLRTIELSVSPGKLARFVSRFGQSFKYRVEYTDETRCRILIYNTEFARSLESNFGRRADGKNLPAWVFSLPLAERAAIIEGYLSTDGTDCGNGVREAESVSKPLVVGMQMLAMGGSTNMPSHRATTTIKGIEYDAKQTWKFSIGKKSHSSHHDNGYVKRLVQSFTIYGSDIVYNLEVEDDNSYTADGIAVHNCQSFSIAGGRAGLQGESRLMFEYIRAVRELVRASGGGSPRYIIWENVPGCLSSNKGRDFGCLLDELEECGYFVAWRTLDSQFARVFDRAGGGFRGPVPQRRRRVFLVGSLGGPSAADILFERSCLRGDHPKGREAREALAEDAPGGAGVGDCAGFRYNQRPSSGSIGYGPISPTVDADSHPNGVLYSIPENAINRPSGGTNGPMAYGGDEPSPTLRASKDQPAVMVDYKQTPKVSEGVSHTLTHEGDGGIHSAVVLQPGSAFMNRCMRCGSEAVITVDDPQEPEMFWRYSAGCGNMGCEDYGRIRKSFKTRDEAVFDWNDHCKRVFLRIDEKQDAIALQSDGSSSNGNQNGCGYNDDGSAYTVNGRDRQSACIQGSMVGRDDANGPRGGGYNEDLSFTLNTTDRHAVAFAQNTRDEVRLFGGDGQTVGALSAQPGMKQTSYIMTQYGDVAGTLNARGDSSPCADRGQNVVCMQDGQAKGTIADDVSTTLNASHEQPIVIARAAFNQGENARFDPHVEGGGGDGPPRCEGTASGSYQETVGALCASDAKMVGSQYVNSEKVVVQWKRP